MKFYEKANMGTPNEKELGLTSQFSGHYLLAPPIFDLLMSHVKNAFFLKIK